MQAEAKRLAQVVKEHKSIISKQNSEIQTLLKNKAQLEKTVNELNLKVIEMEHNITRLKAEGSDSKASVRVNSTQYKFCRIGFSNQNSRECEGSILVISGLTQVILLILCVKVLANSVRKRKQLCKKHNLRIRIN